MKNFYVFLILCVLSQPVFAKTVVVQALDDFSTQNPPRDFSVVILEDLEVDDTCLFNGGDILEGKIVDVKSPKRLKRNAGFTFVPTARRDGNGVVSEIKGYYPAKYTTKLNKASIAKSAALGVGNYFVKGLSMGYSALEGAVKNEKHNRFKSSVNSVYENSPLSYIEKGCDIVIKKEQNFLLNFKTKNEEVQPNYEYTPLEENQNEI